MVSLARIALILFLSIGINLFSSYAQNHIKSFAEIKRINQKTPLTKVTVVVLNRPRLGNLMDHDFWISQFDQKLMPIRDSLHNYYIPKNHSFTVNVRLDSIYPLYHMDTMNTDQLENISLNYDVEVLLSRLGKSLMFTDLISEGQSLEIAHVSDNSWVIYNDTILLTKENNQIWLDWNQKTGSGERLKIKQKKTPIDSTLLAELIAFEKQIVYDIPFKKIKFESCGNCRGTQSIISMTMGSYRKEFIEPTCQKIYLRTLRKLVFEPNE